MTVLALFSFHDVKRFLRRADTEEQIVDRGDESSHLSLKLNFRQNPLPAPARFHEQAHGRFEVIRGNRISNRLSDFLIAILKRYRCFQLLRPSTASPPNH